MTQHTPGPWRHTRNAENTRWIIDADVGGAIAITPDNVANARLIAAAPDLYEALKRLSQLADAIWVKMSDAEFKAMREAWDQADAAIAKAEGRS